MDVTGLERGSDFVVFQTESGKTFKMFHEQDCCENVYLEDVNGEVEDILNRKVISAYEAVNDASYSKEVSESGTWTFYHIRTEGGDICMRWIGESNGYYSESVTFCQL